MTTPKKLARHIMTTATALLLAAGAASCTDNFDKINDNPNAPTTATVALLLNPQLRSIAYNYFNYSSGASLAHQVTNYEDHDDDAQYYFDTRAATWNTFYSIMSNVQDLIRAAERDGQPSAKAVGYTLKALCAAELTDHWGSVPYFEALNGKANIYPKYDSQSDIYTAEGGIIDLLDKAVGLLEQNNDQLPADIVYGGDHDKWLKLANSLRLRLLMRISNRRADIAAFNFNQELADCLSRPLLQDNSDNFSLDYLADAGNRNPLYNWRDGEFSRFRMGKEMDERLNSTNDPRRDIWFQPTAQSVEAGAPTYSGVPCGCYSETIVNMGYDATNLSLLGTVFRATPNAVPAVVINAAEVKLLQAEASVRGWSSGNAAQLYEQGVRLSMEQWGIADGEIDAYLRQSSVTYDASRGLEQVMTQKWLANFLVGYENWYDFLRTGLPQQHMPIDNRDPKGGIPSRNKYPADEQAENKAQYDAAIAAMGGTDDVDFKLWWQRQ